MNLKQTPFLKIKTIKIDIEKTSNTEGVHFLKSTIKLKARPHRMTHRLIHWAKKTPDKVLLAQRKTSRDNIDGVTLSHPVNNSNDSNTWETLTYADALKKVKALAHFLLQTNVSPERPIAILSENSIEHGLMALAALHIGVPYAPIAPAYSLKSTDYAKLKHTIDILTPALIFVQNGKQYEKALAAIGFTNVGEVQNLADVETTKIVAANDPLNNHLVFDDLIQNGGSINVGEVSNLADVGDADVDDAHKKITPDTIAKILFTSGSTGLPKGVINTHGNITANWQQITQTFPFMANGGLTIVDWLPWNHTFGGNHNFGLTLFNGGTLYIDGGNPTPSGIKMTVENLCEVAPSIYFNVSKGFEELLPYLQKNKVLCKHFFTNLKMFFYAGSGMPQHVWDALEQIAYDTMGRRLMIATGLGMTEASPSCLFNTHWGSFAGMIGVPVPELDVKLVPNEGKLEARFKGPNLTKGYWRNPEATEKVFDEDGYYITGDALKFVDENDPNAGMIFDGRIAEDFKLDTGTWVSVGVLKAKLIAAGNGLIQDVVITGPDRAFLGAIVFPELNFCRKLANLDATADLKTVVNTPSVLATLQTVLNDFAKQSTGSSTLIKRALFADFELSIDKGEITDKGTINQRQILTNWSAYVERIYAKKLIVNVLESQS